MHCTNCYADITAWINKYKTVKKVRLDEQYFKDEKLLPKYDEAGVYIDGEKFYEHESKRCLERCPKCGSKNSMEIDEEITWAPV
jgi:copper chaperone CopZ